MRLFLLLLVWHAPLRVRSTKRRHQSPEWTILSHSHRLIQGEIVRPQVLLDMGRFFRGYTHLSTQRTLRACDLHTRLFTIQCTQWKNYKGQHCLQPNRTPPLESNYCNIVRFPAQNVWPGTTENWQRNPSATDDGCAWFIPPVGRPHSSDLFHITKLSLELCSSALWSLAVCVWLVTWWICWDVSLSHNPQGL